VQCRHCAEAVVAIAAVLRNSKQRSSLQRLCIASLTAMVAVMALYNEIGKAPGQRTKHQCGFLQHKLCA
jgi:hypothetical protein